MMIVMAWKISRSCKDVLESQFFFMKDTIYKSTRKDFRLRWMPDFTNSNLCFANNIKLAFLLINCEPCFLTIRFLGHLSKYFFEAAFIHTTVCSVDFYTTSMNESIKIEKNK